MTPSTAIPAAMPPAGGGANPATSAVAGEPAVLAAVEPRRGMTLATKLTLLRVALVPLFMVAFLWGGDRLAGDWGKFVATVVFIAAAITDYYDGALARFYREETRLGKVIDPIADKLLVTAALVLLAEQRAITHVPGWMAVLVIGREFVVTGLRLLAGPRGAVIEVTDLAKWKTGLQLTALISAQVFVCFEVLVRTFAWSDPAIVTFFAWRPLLVQALLGLAVVLTWKTGYDYLRANWHLVDEPARPA